MRRPNAFYTCAAVSAAIVVLFFLSSQIFHYNDALLRYTGSIPKPAAEDESVQDTSDESVAVIEGAPVANWIEAEDDLGEGFRRYTRRVPTSNPQLLVLVLTKDAESWGHNVDQPLRTFEDFLDMLGATGYEANYISLGLLTSDPTEYHKFKEVTKEEDFGRVTVFLHPGYNGAPDRGDRHKDEYQASRRREIARIRNYLMYGALADEAHVLWLDADVYILKEGIVQAMIAHTVKSDVGVITARCEIGPLADYDGNAYAFVNKINNASIEDGDKKGGSTTGINPKFKPGSDSDVQAYIRPPTYRVGTLLENTNDGDLIPLDSVGGTILYMRASLIRQGLSFTYQYIVGTTWDTEGYDGIETEGLCFRSWGLDSGCYLMGGSWMVRHTDR